MSRLSFDAALEESTSGRGGHWVCVPDDVVSALGGGRARVKAWFDGVPYRGSVARYAGSFVLGVQKAIIAEAGLNVGEPVRVELEPDREERTVDVPGDLAERLAAEAALQAAWDRLSYTARKQMARGIAEAKRQETRNRRLESGIEQLRKSQ